MSDGDITVKDNATIKATAYGDSICLGGDLAVIGGKMPRATTLPYMAQLVYPLPTVL